jgi:dephospho-CoA kinase
LEAILHPLIFTQINRELKTITAPYCLISLPLLVETNSHSWVDKVLVVDCPFSVQMKRVKQRDTLNEAQIIAIINTQASREERLAVADDIIDNTKTVLELAQQVKKRHTSYLLLSQT